MYWYLEWSELERGLGLESSIRQPPLRLVLERILAPQELHPSHRVWHISYLLACLNCGPIGQYVIFKSCLPILHFVFSVPNRSQNMSATCYAYTKMYIVTLGLSLMKNRPIILCAYKDFSDTDSTHIMHAHSNVS